MPFPIETPTPSPQLFLCFVEDLISNSPDASLRKDLHKLAVAMDGVRLPGLILDQPTFSRQGLLGLGHLIRVLDGMPRRSGGPPRELLNYLSMQAKVCHRLMNDKLRKG